MTTKVEIRCPNGPQRLLAILRQQGQSPHITDGNLIEFACADCRRLRRHAGDVVQQVLHRYNLAGDLVETAVLPG